MICSQVRNSTLAKIIVFGRRLPEYADKQFLVFYKIPWLGIIADGVVPPVAACCLLVAVPEATAARVTSWQEFRLHKVGYS